MDVDVDGFWTINAAVTTHNCTRRCLRALMDSGESKGVDVVDVVAVVAVVAVVVAVLILVLVAISGSNRLCANNDEQNVYEYRHGIRDTGRQAGSARSC